MTGTEFLIKYLKTYFDIIQMLTLQDVLNVFQGIIFCIFKYITFYVYAMCSIMLDSLQPHGL